MHHPPSPKTPRAPETPPPQDEVLPMPHERDQSPGSAGTKPRKVMERARRDLESGGVDTDLRGTPGLDAERRDELLKRKS